MAEDSGIASARPGGGAEEEPSVLLLVAWLASILRSFPLSVGLLFQVPRSVLLCECLRSTRRSLPPPLPLWSTACRCPLVGTADSAEEVEGWGVREVGASGSTVPYRFEVVLRTSVASPTTVTVDGVRPLFGTPAPVSILGVGVVVGETVGETAGRARASGFCLVGAVGLCCVCGGGSDDAGGGG